MDFMIQRIMICITQRVPNNKTNITRRDSKDVYRFVVGWTQKDCEVLISGRTEPLTRSDGPEKEDRLFSFVRDFKLGTC